MHILITGATGLVGRELTVNFLRKGYKITVVGRSDEKKFRKKFSYPCSYINWNQLNKANIAPVDTVLHLAGESIGSGRWTRKKKERIFNSRVETARKLSSYLIKTDNIPKLFISASGVGFYGETKEPVDESGVVGSDFLAEVCSHWEGASKKLRNKCRVVYLRLGVVLSDRGGFLQELENIFRKGVGGVIASGKQYLSWIHIDDVIKSVNYIIDNKNLVGPINVCSPNPINNKDMTKQLAKALKVPALFIVPKIALKLLLGEKSVLALISQNVKPSHLVNNGFKFSQPKFEEAVADIYKWKIKRTDRLYFSEHFVEKDIDSVFSFFSEAKNLEKITPPLLKFKIVDMSTSKIKMGTVINYRLKIHGLPARWRTLISQWSPPNYFQDNQEKGPYDQWTHTHKFQKLANGTLMTDKIVYRLPFFFIGDLLGSNFVLKDIHNIFIYRNESITTHLE